MHGTAGWMARRLLFVAAGGVALAWAPPAAAQGTRGNPFVPGDGFGFRAGMGYTEISGDYGDLITDGLPAEGGIWYQKSHFRGGLNVQVASYDVIEPFDSQSISQVELALSGLYRFLIYSSLQPFVGARAGLIRFRPEGALFDPNPPGPDVLPGENPSPERTGFIGGVTGGVEYWLNKHVGLQASAVYRFYSTEELDVLLIGETGIESGRALDLRFSIEWKL